jgi:enterochelin esterase-like enzyme
VQSWSGYQLADNIPAIFGRDPKRLARNSPALTLPGVAVALRKAHTFIWFYSGTRDPMLKQNQAFARELTRLRIAHEFFVAPGGHTWHVWRDNAEAAILAAASRLAHG